MPLKIEVKTGDKIIINGAVLENNGPTAKFLVHNKCLILREKEVMSEESSNTPASRVYFALQCAYIFPAQADEYLKAFSQYAEDFLQACPSSAPIMEKVVNEVSNERLYKGLKAAKALLKHEEEIMALSGTDLRAMSAPAPAETAEEEPAPSGESASSEEPAELEEQSESEESAESEESNPST